ncbi:MAG: putative Diguanylate kinase [Modestobacter sp.]|jgi:diguanylate cyclase (GGDEF)-like protein|nr:putative Diguanylate kinase [Modestobacter sp.]
MSGPTARRPSPAHVCLRLRRPDELVERTRWLFFVCVLVSLGLTALGAVPQAGAWSLTLLAVSSAALAGSWVHQYLARRATLVLDVSDVLATALFALACPEPAVAIGMILSALWFRAVYGRTRAVGGYAIGMSLALVASTVCWDVVPGHATSTPAGPVLGALPVMLLNAVVARHLARGLFEREQAQAREAALAALGSRLLGVTDLNLIRRWAWQAAEAICRATPGLRVTVLTADGEDVDVAGHAGAFLRRPPALPRDLLPLDGVPGEPLPFAAPAALTEAAGTAGAWLSIPVPDRPRRVMLVGGSPVVPHEGLVAVRSMVNQVALAMGLSDAHRDLQQRAHTDALTGLANRAVFSAALAEALRGGDGAWVLFLDLDDFKLVNDALGHVAGDRLLGHLGARLTGVLRRQDLCARLGGDEFAILLREADEDDARVLGRRVVDVLSTPVQLAEGTARIGASVGAAAVRPGASETEIVQQADLAMYAAKSAGKNRVQVFHPGLLRSDETARLAVELRAAADNGELLLFYQPIVSVADGRCAAVEALVRWAHPTRGVLAPDSFLDVAEQTGAIVAIGEHTLRQACADGQRWADLGHPVPVHVNASATQLAHPRFVEVVRECLARESMDPRLLVVEITESTVLDSPAVHATLDELVGLGVGLALDDFGTGYASLTTLRSLPIDTVKIDKSFVARSASEPADQVVVEAIVQMAGRLGLHTVAEGVETPAQQRYLEGAGIDAVQGYLHLAPVPAGEFTTWLCGSPGRSAAARATMA